MSILDGYTSVGLRLLWIEFVFICSRNFGSPFATNIRNVLLLCWFLLFPPGSHHFLLEFGCWLLSIVINSVGLHVLGEESSFSDFSSQQSLQNETDKLDFLQRKNNGFTSTFSFDELKLLQRRWNGVRLSSQIDPKRRECESTWKMKR